jgi:hypothetical protein
MISVNLIEETCQTLPACPHIESIYIHAQHVRLVSNTFRVSTIKCLLLLIVFDCILSQMRQLYEIDCAYNNVIVVVTRLTLGKLVQDGTRPRFLVVSIMMNVYASIFNVS